MNKQQKAKEIIICVILGIFFILTLIKTINPIAIFNCLNIALDFQSQQELFLELFSVQATIATLSVSIIAIITGFQKKDIHGISVIRYVSYLRPKLFKHPWMMIFDIIITVANYIFVSFELYNLSIFMFVLSSTISAILILDVSVIYKRNSDLESEVSDFILINYQDKIIDDLNSSIKHNCASSNTLELSSDLEVLIDIFEKELNISNGTSKISKKIEKILSTHFNNYYNAQNKDIPLILLKYINLAYKKANSQEKIIGIDIWSYILDSLLKMISIIGPQKLRNQENIHLTEFINHVIDNCEFNNENGNSRNNFRVEYFYSWCYYYLTKDNNKTSNNIDIEFFKERFFDDSYWSTIRTNEKKEKSLLYLNQFVYLLKTLLECGESEYIYKNFVKRIRHNSKYNNFVYSYVLIIIYSYYLGYCEYLVNDKPEKQYGKELIQLISQSIRQILYSLDLKNMLKMSYNQLKEQLRSWEKFEIMEVKAIIIEGVIEKVVLTLLCEKYYFENDIYDCLKEIDGFNAMDIISRYFSDYSDFENHFKNIYSLLFNKQLKKNKFSIFKSALYKKYKDEQINDGIKNAITTDSLNKFEKTIYELAQNESSHLSTSFLFKPDESQIKTTSMKLVNLGIVDNYVINDDTISEHYETFITASIFSIFIQTIISKIKLEEIDYENNEKQKTLIELSKSYTYDLVIGNEQTFYEEENQEFLNEHLKGVKRIKCNYPYGDNLIILIDSKSMYFKISNIIVNSRDVKKDDYANLNIEQIDNNNYGYSRYSNMERTPYEEKELLAHLNRTMKVVDITADVSFAFNSEEEIGCGINIVFDDEDDE